MKLAIVILGKQNSGKTTTLKHIVNTFTRKNLNRLMPGWQELEPFNEIMMLKLHSYFVPSSPSEKDKTLFDRFENPDNAPEILFMAEQTDGRHRANSYQFLNENDYEILEYPLTNEIGEGVWDRFTPETQEEKLDTRTQEVITKLKEEIKAVLLKKN